MITEFIWMLDAPVLRIILWVFYGQVAYMTMFWFSGRFSFLISGINGIPDLNFWKPKTPQIYSFKKCFIIKIKSTFRQLYVPFVLRKESENRIGKYYSLKTGKYLANISVQILANISVQKLFYRSLWGLLDLLPKRTLGSFYFKMNFTLDLPCLSSQMLFPLICILLCQMYKPSIVMLSLCHHFSFRCMESHRPSFGFNFLVFHYVSCNWQHWYFSR